MLKNLLYLGEVMRVGFEDHYLVAKDGGSIIGAVIGDGYAEFDGVDDVITYNKDLSNVKSIVLDVYLGSDTESVLQLSSTVSISVSGGVVTTSGISSPSIYVDGVSTSSIEASKWCQLIITTATGFDVDDLRVGQVSASYGDIKVRSVALWEPAFTESDIGVIYTEAIPFCYEKGVGMWPLHDKIGTSSFTTTGLVNNLNLTLGDGVTSSTFPKKLIGRNGYMFDGGDYLRIQDASELQITGSISIAMWVQANRPSVHTSLLTKNIGSTVLTAPANTVFEIAYFNADGNIYFQFSNGTLKENLTVPANLVLNGAENLLVFTWDGTTGANGVKAYVNGIKVSETTSIISSIQVADTDLMIGDSVSTTGLVGNMYSFCILDKELSPLEIMDMYNSGSSGLVPSNGDIITKNLVLNHDYTGGDVRDGSGLGNHGSITGGELFIKSQSGWSAVGDYNNSRVVVSSNSSLALDAFSLVVHGDLPMSINGTQYILDRSSGINTDIKVYFSATNTITVDDGNSLRTITVNPSDISGAKTLAFTKGAGADTVKLFIDGAYHGDFSGTSNITSNGSDITLLSEDSGANYCQFPVNSVLLYTDEKSSQDINNIHVALIQRGTDFLKKRNFTGDDYLESLNTGSGWNMDIIENRIIDQGKNQYNGTVSGEGTLIQDSTVWGAPAVKFHADSARFDCGAAPELDFTTETFGGWMWVKPDSVPSNTNPIFRGGFAASGWYININAGGTFRFFVNQLGTFQQAQSGVALTVGRWNLVAWLSVAGDKNYVYMDGEQVGTTPDRVDPAPASGTYNLTIGTDSNGNAPFRGSIGDRVRISEFSSREDFEAQLKVEWNRVANKIIYQETFDDAHIMQSATTTGVIDGTEYAVTSIGGKIEEDEGDKYITSSGAGAFTETRGIAHNFGRVEIDLKPVADARCRHVLTQGSGFAILDVGNASNNNILYLPSSGGSMTTAPGSLSTERQTIRIDKKANTTSNNCTLYKDGEKLIASTGSNPLTDTTNFTDLRQLAHYSGSRIYSITHRFGVPLE